MLTRKAKYALIAMTYLASHKSDMPILIARLSKDTKVPRKFLEKILLDLKSHGLLRSQKGQGGGYFLGKSPEQISVGDVIRIMDGPLAPVSCVSQTAYAPCAECQDEATCGLRLVMKEARDAIAKVLDNTTVSDLVRRGVEVELQRKGLATYEI